MPKKSKDNLTINLFNTEEPTNVNDLYCHPNVINFSDFLAKKINGNDGSDREDILEVLLNHAKELHW